jgi:hypothetical protein
MPDLQRSRTVKLGLCGLAVEVVALVVLVVLSSIDAPDVAFDALTWIAASVATIATGVAGVHGARHVVSGGGLRGAAAGLLGVSGDAAEVRRGAPPTAAPSPLPPLTDEDQP